MIELRCPLHLHGRLDGPIIRVKCRQCSRDAKRPVYHDFDAETGVLAEPQPRQHGAGDGEADREPEVEARDANRI